MCVNHPSTDIAVAQEIVAKLLVNNTRYLATIPGFESAYAYDSPRVRII